MDLYDGIIKRTSEYLSAYPVKRYSYDESKCWRETDTGEMIMLREAAFELGGGDLESVNFTCVTSNEELVGGNEILLYGPELNGLRQDVSFARIVFLTTGDMGRNNTADDVVDDDSRYRFIRELEYVRYHVFPKGYMVRTSAKSSREQARVSYEALKAGISFEKLGCTYIRKYLENPKVKSVQVMFLVGMKPLTQFLQAGKQVEAVTEALDHILKGMPMNCGTCDLQVICNEVEGMRKLHQQKL